MTSLPKLLKLKDYITLTGTTLGVLALVCAIVGTRYFISFGFFLVTCTLGTDLLDGFVARRSGTVNQFGIELDSLSDSLTFGIAPAVLIYQAFRTGGIYDFVLIIGCICFALGAILRLARFNITTEEETGYTGVPTPLSCLIIIVFFYTNHLYALALGGLSYPFPEISYYSIPIFMILIGWFNITTYMRFGEKGKTTYIIILILAPLAPIMAILALLNLGYLISMILCLFFLFCFFLLMTYAISGFFRKS